MFRLIFALSIILSPMLGYAGDDLALENKLIIFHSPACHKCIEVKEKILPDIEKEFRDRVSFEYRDIGEMDNYKLMLGLKGKYAPELKITIPVFYFAGQLLSAEAVSKESLRQFINQGLMRTEARGALPTTDLVAYFLSFKPFAIISAGLIDGINPCAFTVIVFFISFLTLQGYGKREIIATSLSFIFAVFLTYLLLGLGLFSFLYRLKGFRVVSSTLNLLVGAFSIILGFLALYDLFKFKKTKETEGLILQLPQKIKNQIHSLIGRHYRKTGAPGEQGLKLHIFNLILSALITGFLVSILEAVCTGQVYLPTVIFVLKTTSLKLPALGYLLLYNLMFILPLLAIFLFALWGVSSSAFAHFLKKHLVTVKMLMAVLFFSLGLFLVWKA